MIDYSIKKPHALCGHFIKINTQEEYDELKTIAEGCGFELSKIYPQHIGVAHVFCNDFSVRVTASGVEVGQQITMSELRQLAELSKIELPCEMEVSDDGDDWYKVMVVNFYEGCALLDTDYGRYTTYKHFRVDLKSKRKAELVKIIDMAKKELEELNKGKV